MTFDEAEHIVSQSVMWLRVAVESAGAVTVGVGVVFAFGGLWLRSAAGDLERFTSVRIALARFLALALEFQLAADVLSTAVAPSWNELGKLGATAAIRTSLNFFLMREIRELAPAAPGQVA